MQKVRRGVMFTVLMMGILGIVGAGEVRLASLDNPATNTPTWADTSVGFILNSTTVVCLTADGSGCSPARLLFTNAAGMQTYLDGLKIYMCVDTVGLSNTGAVVASFTFIK